MIRASTVYLISCIWLAGACSSGPAPTPVDPADSETATATETDATDESTDTPAEPEKPKISKEEQERQKRLERIAEVKAKMEADAAAESERWTDELRAETAKMVKKLPGNSKRALAIILASPHRQPGNADRDAHRHPAETLLFFGIKPKMTVVEAGAGGGWYTEILGPFLAKKGKLLAVTYDPDGPEDQMMSLYGMRVQKFLANAPEIYGTTELVPISPPDEVSFGPAGSADLVLVVREMHNWHRSGNWDAYMNAAHEVLKPGGVLGIVQHRAAPGQDPAETAKTGYISEDWMISAVESAGFKLLKKSDINANPKDTKDYPGGVWTLPPRLRGAEDDKEKYEAIGESDRMTLKFKKVKK